MSALADMLASAPDGEDGKGMEDGGSSSSDEARKMGVESVKAFFEAGKSGDYEKAYEHLGAAIEHCENTEYDDGKDGGGDEPPAGHGGLVIAIPHKG